MLKLYLMKAESLFPEQKLARAYGLVEQERSERAARIKREGARALSLAAGLLLAYAVQQEEKYPPKGTFSCACSKEKLYPVYVPAEEAIAALQGRKPLEIAKAPEGKPFLKSPQGLFFNLSHSGAYAACAVSDGEVGLDIQQYRAAVKAAAVDRVLHEKEKAVYAALEEEERQAFFLECWAAKEAYVKCTGEGLAKSFSSLFADRRAGVVTDTQSGGSRRLYVAEPPAGYVLFVCTETKIS